MEARIIELENQVKGLMATVTQMHGMLMMDRRGVPRPDHFTSNKVEYTPVQQAGISLRAGAGLSLGKANAKAAPASPAKVDLSKVDISKLEPYKYSSLDQNSRQIRYLTVEPSNNPNDPIHVHLSTISINDISSRTPGSLTTAPPFMTLSYQWGDPSNPQAIVVDGKLFYVTRNLYKALLYFRTLDSNVLGPSKWLDLPDIIRKRQTTANWMWWIDAICINQQDLDEKCSQVRLMTAIYRGAQIVHVWLGEERDDSDHAIAMLRKLGREPTRQEWDEVGFVKKEGAKERYVGPGLEPEILPDDPVPESDAEKDRTYQSIVRLMSREYFSRIWVRQEVALPDDVRFHCGTQVITWDQMMNAVSLMTFLADDHCLPNLQRFAIRERGSAVSVFRRAEELKHLRETVDKRKHVTGAQGGGYLALRGVLFHARNSNATDSRDKVFAMLPLVHPDEIKFPVDYRRPYHEVYKDVVLGLRHESLDFFSACQNKGGRGIPSWVPDLSQKWSFLPLWMSFDDPHAESAPKDFRGSPPETEHLTEQNILRVKGIIFDEVAIVSNDTAHSNDLSLPVLESLLGLWQTFYYTEHKQLNAKVRSEAGKPPRGEYEQRDPAYEPYDNGYYESNWNIDWTVWQFYNNNDYGGSLFTHKRSNRTSSGKEFETNPLGRTVQDNLMTGSLKKEIYGAICHRKSSPWQETARNARSLFVGRKMVGTKFGAFGLLPGDVQVGDRLAQFKGTQWTYVLRQRGTDGDGTWSLLGDAYFMRDIQPLEMSPKPKLQDIDLV